MDTGLGFLGLPDTKVAKWLIINSESGSIKYVDSNAR